MLVYITYEQFIEDEVLVCITEEQYVADEVLKSLNDLHGSFVFVN